MSDKSNGLIKGLLSKLFSRKNDDEFDEEDSIRPAGSVTLDIGKKQSNKNLKNKKKDKPEKDDPDEELILEDDDNLADDEDFKNEIELENEYEDDDEDDDDGQSFIERFKSSLNDEKKRKAIIIRIVLVMVIIFLSYDVVLEMLVDKKEAPKQSEKTAVKKRKRAKKNRNDKKSRKDRKNKNNEKDRRSGKDNKNTKGTENKILKNKIDEANTGVKVDNKKDITKKEVKTDNNKISGTNIIKSENSEKANAKKLVKNNDDIKNNINPKKDNLEKMPESGALKVKDAGDKEGKKDEVKNKVENSIINKDMAEDKINPNKSKDLQSTTSDIPPETPVGPMKRPKTDEIKKEDKGKINETVKEKTNEGEVKLESSDEKQGKILGLSKTIAKITTNKYVAPPSYEDGGRGLVYNCLNKHWACVNKESYFKCHKNNSWLLSKNKRPECAVKNVYASREDCEIVQLHYTSTNESTDFCGEDEI